MKKTKIIMPMVAFVFALVCAFSTHQSNAHAAAFPGFYYNILGICLPLPLGSCNNDPFGAICVFDDGSGYSAVHANQLLVYPNLLRCDIVLRHSLNGGMIN